MEIGLLIRYGKLVPARETQAMVLFQESVAYFQEKLAAGDIGSFEPYFFMTSDLDQELGFFVVKGPAPTIFALMEQERYRPGRARYEGSRGARSLIRDGLDHGAPCGTGIRAAPPPSVSPVPAR